MKRTLIVMAVLVFATAAFAVDASQQTEQGTKALLFNAAFVNAGLYNGGFGMKYYLSPGLALRPVLKFGYEKLTTQTPADSFNAGGGDVGHRTYDDATDKTTSFGLDLAIEKSMWSNKAVNVYLGLGGGFDMSSETVESGVTTTYTTAAGVAIDQRDVDTWKTERSSTGFGGGLLLGAEWFLTENISLGAEYQLGVSMSSEGKDETVYVYSETTGGAVTTITTTTNNSLTSTMDLGFQTIGLTLGIRF